MDPLLAYDSAVAPCLRGCLAFLQSHSFWQISSRQSSQTISLQSTAVLTLGLLSNTHAPAPCHCFVLEDLSVWFSELLHLKMCSWCIHWKRCPSVQLLCVHLLFNYLVLPSIFFVFNFCQSNLYMSLHGPLWFYIVQDFFPSWTWVCFSSLMSGKFMGIICSNISQVLSIISFYKMQMLMHLMLSQMPMRLSLFLLILCSILWQWFPTFCLPALLFIYLFASLILLLISTGIFFILELFLLVLYIFLLFIKHLVTFGAVLPFFFWDLR